MKFYALHIIPKLLFACVSKTEKELDAKIESTYQGWRGYQPKGHTITKDDYMKTRKKVIVTVEPIK